MNNLSRGCETAMKQLTHHRASRMTLACSQILEKYVCWFPEKTERVIHVIITFLTRFPGLTFVCAIIVMQVETVVALEIGILYTDKQAYVASGPNIQQ